MIHHFNPKRGKFINNMVEEGSQLQTMKGFIKLEREMYGGDISRRGSNELHKLLNKVNPVGGRFDLKTPDRLKEFYKNAEEAITKFELELDITKKF